MTTIDLGDGRRVELGEPTVGGSKNETRVGQIGHQDVVVKIEGPYGRLAHEQQALRFLAQHGVCVPRVIASGVTPEGQRFLVMSREKGAPATTPIGWERFGRDLAALLEVPIAGSPLPRVTTKQFVADHRKRLQLVRPLLNNGLSEAISDAITEIASGDRLVVTHGDPGSGNYLENPFGDGTLLDWETASVSPFGLDVGRAGFIGLMDLWQTDIPDQLVAGFHRGYAYRTPLAAMSRERRRAWTTIGGLQFIHGRHTQPLLPERTPQIAAHVLTKYLATTR